MLQFARERSRNKQSDATLNQPNRFGVVIC